MPFIEPMKTIEPWRCSISTRPNERMTKKAWRTTMPCTQSQSSSDISVIRP